MTTSEAVAQSFGRCILQGDVIQRFYNLLMEGRPDIRLRFAHTDFVTQKKLLRQAVGLIVLFAAGNPVGRNGIDRIRESHGPDRLNIPRHLYVHWKRAFIQAVSEFDREFTTELQAKWDEALEMAIDYITGHPHPA